MKFSLIHPSRGRSDKAKSAYLSWIGNASGDNEIEHILSLDHSDYTASRYVDLFKYTSKIIQNPNTCVVEAANFAATESTGDILIYSSDDFEFPKNWDKTLEEVFRHITQPLLLKASDGVTAKDLKNETGTDNILTIPIMNRLLFERLGYFFHPGYRSMFADEHLFNVVLNNGWLLRREDIVFLHNHWINKRRGKDETDIRSEQNWKQGKALFEQHKLLNFPI